MSLLKVLKPVALCFTACLCVLSSGQIFSGEQYYDLDRTVIVPPSSIAKQGFYHSHYLVQNRPVVPGGLTFFSGPAGFHPADIQSAYQIPSNGGGDAIAIIDAYDNTTNLTDFNTFSTQFGLPKEPSSNVTASTNKVFQVVYASGTKPAANSGWAGEISLDIEWSHAMAPKAKIYLVEAASASFANLNAAVTLASKLPGVHEISMSYGAGEFAGENTYDSIYNIPGVVCFASAGDTGGVQEYPSESVNVVGVGGTSLHMSGGKVTSETTWTGSGGGPSSYETIPTFQSVISALLSGKRGCPDIAGVANPSTGVAVFGQFAAGGWFVVGGTSVACPVEAGIANARKSYSSNSKAELVRDYMMLGDPHRYRDITSGTAGSFTAKKGWDFITGCGCPLGLLGTPVSYLPTSVNTQIGTYRSGNLASVKALDANYYTAIGAGVSGGGSQAMIVSNVTVSIPSGNTLGGTTVMVAAKPSASDANLALYAYDFGAGRFVLLASSASGATDQTLQAYFPPTGDFIQGSQIRLAVVGTSASPNLLVGANLFTVSGVLQ